MTDQCSHKTPYNNVRRGQMTSSACRQCRKRKVKCTGERPACVQCSRKKDSCIYDVEEGITRLQDLRTRLSSVHTELAQMRSFIHNLQYSSDSDATWLLARLRMGDDVAQLAGVEPLHTFGPPELEDVHVPDLPVQHTCVDTLEGQMSHFSLPTQVRPSPLCCEEVVRSAASYEFASFGVGFPSCQPQCNAGPHTSSPSESIAMPQSWQTPALLD